MKCSRHISIYASDWNTTRKGARAVRIDFKEADNVENMKDIAMLELEVKKASAEGKIKGYEAGYKDGYDRGRKDSLHIINKYHLDERNAEVDERELRPAIRFIGQGIDDLIGKVIEECSEVTRAYMDNESKARIAEELADVQEACETVLSKLGFHESERRKIRLQVIKKNEGRGYYSPRKKGEK